MRIPARFRLLLQLIKRDLLTRTRGTLLGWFWLVMQPALQVVAFYFLFDIILRVRMPGGQGFLDYFLIGIVPWFMLAEALNRSLGILREYRALYERAPFPVSLLPAIPVLVSVLVYFPIYAALGWAFGGVGGMLGAMGVMTLVAIWILPWVLLCATLGLFLRDLANLIPFGLTLLMYATPILYARDMLPPALADWMFLNPFADLIAVAHQWIAGDLAWDWGWMRLLLWWLALALLSVRLYKATAPYIREAL